MNLKKNVPLAPYTSFGLGGNAQNFVAVHSTDELLEVLKDSQVKPIWLIGYGSNTLISDEGLEGLVICLRGGKIDIDDRCITVDAGVWWDDVVKTAIDHGLWGSEMMSEIPGSVGAALYINITAYGQSIGPLVRWIDIWDTESSSIERLTKDQLSWDYKKSVFQLPERKSLVILRACLELSHEVTNELIYQKALDVAKELELNPGDLVDRRKIITEARRRAGSLWAPDQKNSAKTVGSFFRNPVVSQELAERIMSFDESGKTHEEIKRMNKVHGGDQKRVSAAHVMLAAGFKRGQEWGKVKLNDQNLLKIEAMSGATAQEVYDVAMNIQAVCEEKLGVTLQPEAKILGNFQKTTQK